MEVVTNFEQFTFPTKQQMLKKTIQHKQISLRSNHFALSFAKNTAFNEWHMRFFRKEDAEQARSNPTALEDSVPSDARTLIQEIVSKNKKEMVKVIGSCFHTGITLFSFVKGKVNERYVFENHDNHLLSIEVKHKNVDFKSLQSSANSGVRAQMIRFLNSFIKNCLKRLNYYAWGRNMKYYNYDDYSLVEKHNLTIFKGYATSIDIYEGGLKLVIDYSARIIRDFSIWEEFEYYGVNGQNKEAQRDFFIGKSVMSNYGNNRIYRIDDVAFNKKITDAFPNTDYKNYEDYYIKKYKLKKFQYRNQFLLIHKQKKIEMDHNGKEVVKFDEILLIPELMLPTGLTDDMRADYKVMKDIASHTVLRPKDRFPIYNQFNNKIKKQLNENREFNFVIDEKSNKIKGYQMNPPKIAIGKKSTNVKNGSIMLNSLDNGKNLSNWVFLYDFKSKKDKDTVLENLKKASNKFGVKVSNPLAIIELPKKINEKDIDKMIQNKTGGSPIGMIFVMCTKITARHAYKKLKNLYIRKGVPTQFFTSYNFKKDKSNLSKFGNILTQMVVKMKGNLWNVDVSLPNSIIAGADVYHGPRNKSVASLVVQSGKDFSDFFCVPKIQKKGQEIMKNMAINVIQSIKHYKKKHGKLPENFVFFRDGVGEGQLNEVLNIEVRKIVDMSREEFGSQAPKLCFVVVTKRIIDRFAVEGERGLENPSGGLLVVDNVVKSERANFYLIAQKVNMGTATPTHYEVVYNDSSISLDKLINIAYKFTHGYSNWNGPVKVPACVQYAHKQASLIGVTQDDVVHLDLQETRYFM